MKIKKFLTVLLAMVLTFSFVGCNNEENPDNNQGSNNSNITAQDFSVWAIDSYVKVLSTQNSDYYKDQATDSISLVSAKNDHEAGQVIVTAKKDLSFTVALSDLVDVSDSNNVISKDNFTVYTELYISVSRNWHGNGAPTGKYPDALLPQANAVEYGKNVVESGYNGGAYLDYYVPATAKAGTYKGTATVTVGKIDTVIPVSLKVYNVEVPKETASKSLFTVNNLCVAGYELDNSTEMLDKYTDMLLSHRVTPTSLTYDVSGYSGIAKRLYERHLEGVSTLSLSYSADYNDFKTQIKEAIEIALEKQDVDYLEKLCWWDFIIDEPFCVNYADGVVEGRVNAFHQLIEGIVAEMKADQRFNNEFGALCIKAIEEFPYIVTDYQTDEAGNSHRYLASVKDSNGDPYHYPDYVSICGKPDAFDDYEERESYRNGAEFWWYSCNEPSFPYPSYHIDDTMVSHSAMGWMQSEYDIVGNIYWAVNVFYDGGTNWFDDPFAAAQTVTGAAGEGAIIYPGKTFGVDGPLTSMRLEAIRDGYEDYDIIQNLKAAYKDAGRDASKIINKITSGVYSGSTVIGDAAAYRTARETLLAVAEIASSDVKLMITDVTEKIENDVKSFNFELVAAEGAKVYSDGAELTAVDGIYKITKTLTENKNYVNITAEKDGKTASFKLYLGGKQTVYSASEMTAFTDYGITGDVESATLGEDGYYRMKLTGTESSLFEYKHASISAIDGNTEKYIIKLYNYAETEVEFKVYVTYSGFGKVQTLKSKLAKGENELTLDIFPTVNWTRNKSVTAITIEVSGNADLGIGNIIVYGV